MATFDSATMTALHKASTGMGKSKNDLINHMTIPQIKKARELLKTKLNEADLSPAIESKFRAMDAQYAHAQRKIGDVYKITMANATPHIKSVLNGKRDLLTLNTILKDAGDSTYKYDKKDNLQYGGMAKTADFMTELNKSIPLAKVGLGVGIGLAGLGAISLIPGSMGAIGGFLAANPAFTALVASGAAIALAVKVVPAIYKAYKKVKENDMALESTKADMNDAAYEVEKEETAQEQEQAKKEQEAKEAEAKKEQEAKEAEAKKEEAKKKKEEKEATAKKEAQAKTFEALKTEYYNIVDQATPEQLEELQKRVNASDLAPAQKSAMTRRINNALENKKAATKGEG